MTSNINKHDEGKSSVSLEFLQVNMWKVDEVNDASERVK